MKVNEEFLRTYVFVLDSFTAAARENLILKRLLADVLDGRWESRFLAAKGDPAFLGEQEVELALIDQARKQAVAMLEALNKGETLQTPLVRVN
jgi:hypothetical protein